MIERVVQVRRLGDRQNDVAYWLSRPPAERIAHVERLRAEHYGWGDGTGPRFQRISRILRRA